jgi:hypothetical protein
MKTETERTVLKFNFKTVLKIFILYSYLSLSKFQDTSLIQPDILLNFYLINN